VPHRDSLDAAQAKIAALERDLKDARDALAAKAGPRREQPSLAERPPPPEPKPMQTLAEYSRALPATDEWPGAGVLCTSCLQRGERIELVVRALLGVPEARDEKLVDVACLRCGSTGVKRARAE